MTALLPDDESEAAIVNAATMELGATVCLPWLRPTVTSITIVGVKVWSRVLTMP